MPQRDAIYRAIDQVQHLASLFSKRRGDLAAAVGLTDAQWRVLEEIATEHFMPSLFADDRDHSRGAVSKILRQLQDKKLIRVSISQRDARQRNYELTAAGKKKQESLRELRERALRQIWSDLPSKQLKAFNDICEQLITRVRDYSDE